MIINKVKIFMAVLMIVFAMVCEARTLAQGLSAPNTGKKHELRLTPKPKTVTPPRWKYKKYKYVQAPARRQPKAVVFVLY